MYTVHTVLVPCNRRIRRFRIPDRYRRAKSVFSRMYCCCGHAVECWAMQCRGAKHWHGVLQRAMDTWRREYAKSMWRRGKWGTYSLFLFFFRLTWERWNLELEDDVAFRLGDKMVLNLARWCVELSKFKSWDHFVVHGLPESSNVWSIFQDKITWEFEVLANSYEIFETASRLLPKCRPAVELLVCSEKYQTDYKQGRPNTKG